MPRRRFPLFALAWALLLLSPLVALASPAYAAPIAQEAARPAEPEVGAAAAIVVEYPSGRILYQKAAHERHAPASLTKILTAIVAIEYGRLDDVLAVAPGDLVGESSMGLVGGEEQRLRDLLYGVMLPSGNDAAMTVARGLGAKVTAPDPTLTDPLERFIAMMNARVAQLGLEESRFANPHGLDAADHYSSAYDLASLSWYALHLPLFDEIVRQVYYEAPGHALLNTNEILTRYPGADGIKTGWTDACGLCLAASATRDGRRLIVVILNAPHWYNDSALLLDYGFAQLAAAPHDPNAELLSISKRGVANWLLENPPQALSGSPANQGGGVPPQAAGQTGNAPDSVKPAGGDAPAPYQGPLYISASDGGSGGAALVALLFALVGGTCFVLTRRLWGARPAFPSVLDIDANGRRFVMAAFQDRLRPVLYSERAQPASVTRTLGAAGGPSVGRRCEPNLMLTPGEERQAHVARAVQLAWEGRQGSSIAEFLMALRVAGPIEAAEVAQEYQLNAEAFLALARAQLCTGAMPHARDTLLHGMSVLPHERLLRLAYSQLRKD